MKLKLNLKTCLPIIVLVLLADFSYAEAQTVYLKTAKNSYRVGDSFLVRLYIDTGGRPINSVEGKVVADDNLSISNLSYGNSFLSLWVKRPTIDQASNSIDFTGGTPGGFTAGTGEILSLVAKATTPGTAVLRPAAFKVLLNDGLGTELKPLTLQSLVLNILPAAPTKQGQPAPSPSVYVPPLDTTPPENFIPLVSRHPEIAANQYFVSFLAQDKDSGISRYEITEHPYILSFLVGEKTVGPVISDSPYVLKNQLWGERVTVRAYDNAGNFKDGDTWKPFDISIVIEISAFIVLVAVVLTYLLSRSRKKKIRYY